MPADPKEQIRQLPSGKYQLRYLDRDGRRRSGGVWPSKSAARAHYRDVPASTASRSPAATSPTAISSTFLERHAIVAKPRTITELRWRLKQSESKFGTVPLLELEGMSDEIAGYAVTLPERLRYPLMAAFRQALEAGVRYGYLTRNRAKLAGPNPMPPPREIRVFTPDELTAITGELGTIEAAAVTFAAATGLRPSEWASVERRDVDKARRIIHCRTRSPSSRQPLRVHDDAQVPRDGRAGAVRRGELPSP